MDQLIEVSVVIPVLNEEGNVQPLYEKLTAILPSLCPNYEIIFVDDGSSDRTFSIIRSLHSGDARLKGLSFSRNFGHQIALLAGLKHSRGEVVITLDGDLQHPPELLPEMYKKYKEGYDIVNTRRIDEAGIGFFKKVSSWLFYRLINYLSEISIEPASADFRLMNRLAVDAFLDMPERDRFTRGLVTWIGFQQAVVEYKADARAFGHSKYSLKKMILLGLDGLTAFSSRPLRISFYLGTLISLGGLIYAVFAVLKFFSGQTVPGWTSILVSLLIIGGVILINLGIIGEYIARIFNEVKSRPLYFIKEQAGMPKKQQTQYHHEQSKKKENQEEKD